ncbi:putative uncharacterized protein DDB_G0282133 [Octopus bimaculoides]|uniref:C2H2-type domain-containing protein n=1 Tax=Octopus bimaculoides TaxID=37653 RepID=A0A0L8G3P1_OCTBM|nr:putative uncharacterized protein DDB_G0282133 [Octopus bimaculoides]|eukprot:XP_014784504.1 PREDICTED: putative uncharacterized protein DDB_G0282133 [Octopus bimaculoides]
MGATHIEDASAQPGKLYTCEHCQMTFSRPVHLERHMRNVHSQERESECNICHKLFQNKHYLSVHMLTHNVNKELQCPLCKMTFNNLATLNKHKDAHLGIGVTQAQKDNLSNFRQPRTIANLLASNQSSRGNSSNVPLISVAPGINNANTLNCDLRSTDLRSMNKNKRNLLPNQVSLQNAMRLASNDTTVNCDLTSRDINSLNTNQTVRLAQKRPSNSDNDVIVTGVSSLKRPFRFQNLSNSTTPQNRQPSANQLSKAAAISLLSQQLASQKNSQNSLLQNQIQVQSSSTRQNSTHNPSGRNITDRIYLMPENGNNRNIVRMQQPSNFRYSQRKQLAQQPIPNQRYSTNSLYSNPLNQQSQRNVVNCDLTRSDLATISQRSGAAAPNVTSQFSNGSKSNSTVNCDLTISNISSLNRNYRPSNNLLVSRSRNSVSQNNLPSNRVRSAVNFDLTTADINFLRRNRRIRQVERLTDVGAPTVGQTSNTLNCDLSVVNLGAMERNKMPPSNNSRINRINLNQIPKQVQNTLNSGLRANNLNDWNKRNTIVYQQKSNQVLQNPTSHPVNTLNCDLTSVNLGTLNQQQAANNSNIVNQEVRPVQIYANSNVPLSSLVRKDISPRENSMTGTPTSSNSYPVQIVRNRSHQKRAVNVNPGVSTLNNPNAMLISRLNRQRKMLATPNNIPVIDLVAEEEKTSNVPSGSTDVVQFDLTNPDINIISYENGTSLSSSKSTSKNVVDIVDLESHDSSGRPPVLNNQASVVEFDLSNNNIRAFNTNQNRIPNTSTINLNSNLWASSNSTRNNSLNVQSAAVANESSSSLSDITLVDIRSLKPSEEVTETVSRPVDEVGDKSSVSGITLVDIRSLSSAEIEANFQTSNKEPLTITNSETSQMSHSSTRTGNVSDNYQVGDSSLTASKVPALNPLTRPPSTKAIITVDLSSIDFEDIDEAKRTTLQASKSVSEQYEDENFTCKYCSVKVRYLYNYIFHLKSHLETGFCICYYCSSVFEDFRKLVVHLVSHVSNLKNQCVFCRNILVSTTNPIQHMTECGELQCVMFEAGSCVKTEKSEEKNDSKVKTKTDSAAEKSEKEVGNLEERLLEEVEKQALVILEKEDDEIVREAKDEKNTKGEREEETCIDSESNKLNKENANKEEVEMEVDGVSAGSKKDNGQKGKSRLIEEEKEKTMIKEVRAEVEKQGTGEVAEEESKEGSKEEKLDEESIEWKVKEDFNRTDQLISELNQDTL